MNPARLAARHPRAVLLVTALLVAAGLLIGPQLASDIYPPLEFPRVIIVCHSGSTPARSMMLGVARPIEEAVMEVPGIRRVRSKTFRGASEIAAQFASGTDILQALQQVQNRVAELRGELPAGTEIVVDRMTPASFPILSYNLTGGLSQAELHDTAFFVLRPALARVPGVGHIEVLSSDTREIEVVTDPAKLLASGLTAHDVAEAIRSSNVLLPMGRFTSAGVQHLVLASGLAGSVADIAAMPVAVRGGATLRVADVAEVYPGTPDRTSLITGNGQPAALLNVSEQIGASILDIRQGVERALAEMARVLPAGLKLTKVYDLAGFVSDAMASVRDAILVGGALAVLVLFLFLRSWRITVVASLTLPVTVVATFSFLRLFGETINLMSMGGLAVAIGLVIDDAVVVVENIHRHFAAGGGVSSIEDAVSELVAPVVGSTLTTVVVFAPLGLLSGVVGQFFRALSITLTVSVLLSLLLALTLIPLLARWAYARRALSREAPRLDAAYARALDRVLHRPRVLALGVLGLVALAVLTFVRVPTGFLPRMDEGGFVIDYLSRPGSALEETNASVQRIEQLLHRTAEVASFSRRTGSELGLFATQQNKGDIVVRLKPRGERRRSADEVIAQLRAKLPEVVPELEIEFVQLLQDMIGDLAGNPEPIEVKLFGDDQETLGRVAEEVETRMGGVKGIVDVVGVEKGSPEVTWTVDSAAAGRLGLSVQAVGEQLHAAGLGELATDLRLQDRTIPVRVRYPDSVRLDAVRLAQTTLRAPDGKVVPFSALARSSAAAPESVLVRENLRQMALVTARLEARDLGSAVSELRKALAGVVLPPGYTLEIGGELESQRQAFRELLTVLAVAASLVLVILVAEFRAFTPALLILGAAPLSFGGSLLLLLLTGTELNISSAMGFILLVGLVVKNGIVMIDYAHHLQARGASFEEALRQAAHVRLRPILMTTLCTLFGLLPLALGLGAGAELQKPLALVVVGGLALSTVVTLFAVPAFYLALAGQGRRQEAEAGA